MRRYGSKRVPKGASTRTFAMLSAEDQMAQVKKLRASRMSVEAIVQLTGLGRSEIHAMLELT